MLMSYVNIYCDWSIHLPLTI